MKRTKGLKNKRVIFWTKRLNSMIKDRNRAWARDNLKGIRKTIQNTNKVTDKQVRAIKNIQNGKNAAYNE